LDCFNPQSNFFLRLHISSPNASDRILSAHKIRSATTCFTPTARRSVRFPSNPEAGMLETRRVFVLAMAAAAGFLAAEDGWPFAQYPPTPPPPPRPAETPNPAEIHSNPQATAAAKRAWLQQNEKEFREGVERLYQLTGQLREELQKTTTTEVFSVRMVKKTEEIEKLAKLLKNRAKGG